MSAEEQIRTVATVAAAAFGLQVSAMIATERMHRGPLLVLTVRGASHTALRIDHGETVEAFFRRVADIVQGHVRTLLPASLLPVTVLAESDAVERLIESLRPALSPVELSALRLRETVALRRKQQRLSELASRTPAPAPAPELAFDVELPLAIDDDEFELVDYSAMRARPRA